MHMEFEAKYGLVGWLLGIVLKRKFESVCEDVLAGLDTHLATGRIVGQDGDPIGETPPASAAMV